MGKTRSKQQSLKDGPFNGDHEAEVGKAVLNLQVLLNPLLSIYKIKSMKAKIYSCMEMPHLPGKV